MKVCILIDNSPHPENNSMLTEHGLSIYFEMDGYKWMVDCGASGKFLANAKNLGINLQDVDYLLLSHAHADHTGGLAHFLQTNTKATVLLSSRINENCLCFSTRGSAKRNISINFSIVNEYIKRVQFIDRNTQLSENIFLITAISRNYPQPKANRTLLNADSPDDFSHEFAICIDTPDGAIVISSCCHHGLLNTLEASGRSTIKVYIGGMHLIDSCNAVEFETETEIAGIASTTQRKYPGIKIITGHCTGMVAASMFKKVMTDNFHFFHTGEALDV